MERWTRLLLYRGERIERQNVLWNVAGSFCYAFASMVLSFFVMRLAGEEDGGIFSFGFSTLGQQLFIVAYFGIRPFQITDGKGQFSFGDYLRHRKVTSLLALLAAAAYLGLLAIGQRYTPYKAAVLLLLVFYKVVDGYADVYESEFQRRGCLYLTGKSNFFRTIASVGVFLITLAATKSLAAAAIGAAAAQLLGLWLFDLVILPAIDGVDWEAKAGQGRRLTQAAGLLFLSAFLDFYVFSAAKYAIDARLTDADSGYFNLIFMPTSVIYLVANFVIRPFLTRLTDLWENRQFGDFRACLCRIGGIIGGLTVLAVAGTALLGNFVLGIMEMLLGAGYAGSLTRYLLPFGLIVLGGGFYALANLMYYALVIMRRQKMIFAVYLLAAVLAFFVSERFVVWQGILGAAVCYLVLMAGLMTGFFACMVFSYNRERNQSNAE